MCSTRERSLLAAVALLAATALACASGGGQTDGAGGNPGVGGQGVGGRLGTGGSTVPGGNGKTTNLFTTIAGRTQSDVDQKVTTAVNRFFGIGTSEPATPTAASGYRCYYELPQDPSMAFIWAADSDDVRSEGMSYGMMIAVQMNLHDEFDRLWKFAKTYMQFPGNSPTAAWRYYFHWQGTVNRSNATSWTVSFGATEVPAPDGDEYFAAALYVADQRWGSTGTINYKQEADYISAALLHNPSGTDGRFPIISTTQSLVVFDPYGS